MSFGWSVGDLWTIAKEIHGLRKNYSNAPKQFSKLFDELRSLSTILLDIDVLITDQDTLISHQSRSLNDVVSTCNKVHIDVQQLVSKYQILGEPTTTTGQRLKRAWKRLILEPEDIKELRLRITSTIGLANVSIAVLTSKTTSTIHNQVFEVNQKASQISVQVDKVVDTQELERRQALLSWISDTDHEAFLADALSRRQMGTGKWFLNGEAFQNWLNGEESSIFLAQGDPGTGKTIMAAIVIEYLQARIVTDDNIGLAHFFCDFNRTNDSLTIVTSILRQLLNYQSSPEDVNADLYRLQLEGKKLDMVDTKTNLSKIMRGYSKVFLILDALDECEISHLKRIIPILLDPQAHGKVRLIATCRPVPEILQLFPTATVKLLQADTEDIEAYLLCVGQEMRVVQRMPQLLNSIIYAIIKAVDRIFLLAKLHMDFLQDYTTVKKLTLALKQLPTGSDAYDVAYEKAMKRITAQSEQRAQQAIETLTWIVYARGQLTGKELLQALAIEENSTELDPDNIPDMQDVLSCCIGIVSWDIETDIVRLVHNTAQEYFNRTKSLWFPDGETMLGLRCLTYISYKSWLNYNPHLWTISNKDSSLFDYAMLNWGHHLRLGQTSFDLASPYLLADSLEIGKVQTQLYLRDQRMDAIWVCLEFKLSNFTEALLAKGINPCCVDDRGRGLLHAAIEANDEKVARILLKIPDIDVDARDEDGKTALLTAVQSGRLEVLHLLLQDRRVDLTSTCKLGMNVLHRAVRHKSPEVLQLLLDYFYQISIKHPSRDLVHRNDCLDVLKYSGTEIPPGLVAQLDELQGSPTDIALLSVEAGDNSFRSSSQGGICLHDVAKGSNVSHLTKHLELMVPLINALDRCGRTPLIFAISHRRTASAQTLLDRSADTEIADRRGRTALYWAIKRADLQFVRMLIRSHANVNLRTKKGGTLLHEAAAVGILDLVKVLVEEGKADVRVTDANDKTAAEIAYWGQKKDIVQYLELAANTQLLRPTSSSAKRRRRATWPYKDICRSTSGLRVHPDEGPKFLDNPQEQIVDMTQKMRELLWMDFQEFLYTETGLSDSEDYP